MAAGRLLLPCREFKGEEQLTRYRTAPTNVFDLFDPNVVKKLPVGFFPTNNYLLVDVRHRRVEGVPGWMPGSCDAQPSSMQTPSMEALFDSVAFKVFNLISSQDTFEMEDAHRDVCKKIEGMPDTEALKEYLVYLVRHKLECFGTDKDELDFTTLEEATAMASKSTQVLIDKLHQEGMQHAGRHAEKGN